MCIDPVRSSLRSLAQLSHHGDVAEDDGGEGQDELQKDIEREGFKHQELQS